MDAICDPGYGAASDRQQYIAKLSVRLAHGTDDGTCTDGEHAEALELLRRAGISIPAAAAEAAA